MIDLVLQQTQSATTSFTTNSFYVGDASGASIQVSFTGADVVGSFVVQSSVDGVNWAFTSSTTTAVTASTNLVVGTSNVPPPWLRVSWTYTSGTGNITVLAAIRQS